jgi:MyTH4 domain
MPELQNELICCLIKQTSRHTGQKISSGAGVQVNTKKLGKQTRVSSCIAFLTVYVLLFSLIFNQLRRDFCYAEVNSIAGFLVRASYQRHLNIHIHRFIKHFMADSHCTKLLFRYRIGQSFSRHKRNLIKTQKETFQSQRDLVSRWLEKKYSNGRG